MRKDHTQEGEKTTPRGLSADEIDCVVGGVTMRPDGRTCTDTGDRRWRPIGLPKDVFVY